MPTITPLTNPAGFFGIKGFRTNPEQDCAANKSVLAAVSSYKVSLGGRPFGKGGGELYPSIKGPGVRAARYKASSARFMRQNPGFPKEVTKRLKLYDQAVNLLIGASPNDLVATEKSNQLVRDAWALGAEEFLNRAGHGVLTGEKVPHRVLNELGVDQVQYKKDIEEAAKLRKKDYFETNLLELMDVLDSLGYRASNPGEEASKLFELYSHCQREQCIVFVKLIARELRSKRLIKSEIVNFVHRVEQYLPVFDDDPIAALKTVIKEWASE